LKELARFLFDTGHYSPAQRVVRPGAFLPQNGKTSVFAINGLAEPAILEIAAMVASIRQKPAKGRAEVDIADVTAAGLRFERDDVPHRHGNLVGWPHDGLELKARHKAVAVKLAARAELVLH
jgi:hypothetical protein